jgi:uncharacterized protein (TIGR03083 family)
MTRARSWNYTQLDAAECDEIAALLRSLRPEDWDAPTLCDRWRVRDVVGHIVVTGEVRLLTIPFTLARQGFSLDRWVGAAATRRAEGREPEELMAAWEHHVPRTGIARVLPRGVMLYDHFVHHQDIRRPLGRQRRFRSDTLLSILDVAPEWQGAVRSKRRARGLRLETTDVDWTYGDGPVVRGSGEAMLMALAGRRSALDELEGDGLAVLRGRS